MSASVRSELERILADELHVELPAGASREEFDLIASGALDSLTFVELLYHLEQTFGLVVDLDRIDLEDLRTPARLEAFVSRHARASA